MGGRRRRWGDGPFDAINSRWSPELCELAGIRVEDLPEVFSTTDVAGELTAEAAERIGLPSGRPVVVGTLDSAAEPFGAGALEPGRRMVRLATAGGIQLVLPGPKPHPRLITYPHPIAPQWYSQAGTNSCASAVRWATHTLAGNQPVGFHAWDDLARSVPAGSNGLLFHPYLLGERAPYWDPQLRASFVGLTMDHGIGHFARAIYKGTAFSIRDALSAIEGFGISEDPLVAVGGGTMSKVWVQIGTPLVHELAPAQRERSSVVARHLPLRTQ